MSYSDDEELKLGDADMDITDEEDIDLDESLDDPLDDDLLDDDDELSDEFAGLDGSSTDY